MVNWKRKTNSETTEDFSKIIKRPLAVFFLSEPPPEPAPPKDFRMLPDKTGKFDKKTLLAIRRARRLQDISKELSDNLDSSLNPKIKFYSLNDDPKKTAEIFRDEFKFNESHRVSGFIPRRNASVFILFHDYAGSWQGSREDCSGSAQTI